MRPNTKWLRMLLKVSDEKNGFHNESVFRANATISFMNTSKMKKRKTMKRMPIVILILLITLSCEKEPETILRNKQIDVLSTDASNCKNEKTAIFDEYVEKYIVSNVGETVFRIEHENAWFNCCLPKGIEIEVNTGGDTIYYSDGEKEAGICDCICPYNTLAELAVIDSGNYVLCFKSGDEYLGSVELFFRNNMYEEILVSELTDY